MMVRWVENARDLEKYLEIGTGCFPEAHLEGINVTCLKIFLKLQPLGICLMQEDVDWGHNFEVREDIKNLYVMFKCLINYIRVLQVYYEYADRGSVKILRRIFQVGNAILPLTAHVPPCYAITHKSEGCLLGLTSRLQGSDFRIFLLQRKG